MIRFGLQVPDFTYPGCRARRAVRAGRDHRRHRRAGRVRRRHGDGPLLPAAAARPARPRDVRGVHAARRDRRPYRTGAARHARHRRHVPQPGRSSPRSSPPSTSISRGRAFLGIGAAWFDAEHRGLGVDFPPSERGWTCSKRRCRSAVRCSAASARRSTAQHYRTEDAINSPAPIRPGGPPIMVGGQGEKRTLRIAAQYADMANFNANFADIPRKLEVFAAHCAAVGRDPAGVNKTNLGMLVLAPTMEAAIAKRDDDAGPPRARLRQPPTADAVAGDGAPARRRPRQRGRAGAGAAGNRARRHRRSTCRPMPGTSNRLPTRVRCSTRSAADATPRPSRRSARPAALLMLNLTPQQWRSEVQTRVGRGRLVVSIGIDPDHQRARRERAFHNDRYADDPRRGMAKYYASSAGGTRFMARMLELAAGRDVLECGCGKGGKTLDLAPVARRVTAIDLSDVAVVRAAARPRLRRARVCFGVADASLLPFAAISFDVVVGSSLLHHVPIERASRDRARTAPRRRRTVPGTTRDEPVHQRVPAVHACAPLRRRTTALAPRSRRRAARCSNGCRSSPSTS